jgi:acyl-CoA reductase-like NAD-dependent aldehyde dehydrogenase
VIRQHTRIGDRRVDSGRVEVVRNPYDGAPVGEVGVATEVEVDAAIELAARAFTDTRRQPVHVRARVLASAARIIDAHADELAGLMARESGKPIQFCRGEVARAVVTFDMGSAAVRTFHGEVVPVDLEPRAEGRLCITTRVPRGPVAAISPFNFPLNLVAHKLSPAFAVGATVVLKPPPQCPLTAFRLGELLDDAGLDPRALGIVHCPPELGQRLVEDERLRVLSFTGSDAVGWKLKALAGKKQVLLELGGNAPCIVDQDADLDDAVPKINMASWANAGQVCIRVQRVLVHASVYDAFMQRFLAATAATKAGDPLDEKTVVGPIIERKHVERLLAWIREAVHAGATLHCGGEADGNVVQPTILTEVPKSTRVWKDEAFGPVTIVEKFARFEDAIASCNEGRFGLQAGVFTRDVGRALQAFRELDYGGVIVGDTPMFRVDNYPYGGTKDSGFGREGVRWAMEEMTEPKTLVMSG